MKVYVAIVAKAQDAVVADSEFLDIACFSLLYVHIVLGGFIPLGTDI